MKFKPGPTKQYRSKKQNKKKKHFFVMSVFFECYSWSLVYITYAYPLHTSTHTSSLKEMFEVAVNLIQSKENHNICFRVFNPYNVRRRIHVFHSRLSLT